MAQLVNEAVATDGIVMRFVAVGAIEVGRLVSDRRVEGSFLDDLKPVTGLQDALIPRLSDFQMVDDVSQAAIATICQWFFVDEAASDVVSSSGLALRTVSD